VAVSSHKARMTHLLAGMMLTAPLTSIQPAFAQLAQVRSFTVTAEPAKPALGDSVTIHFRLHLNERDLLTDSVPRPVDQLPDGVRLLSVQRLQRGNDRVFTGTAVVAFYRPGKRALPTFGLPWVQIVSGHRGVVAHDPVEIEVASVLPAGNPPLRDIREPEAPRGLGILWASIGALATGMLAWLLARRQSKQTVPAPLSTPPPAPAPPADPYTETLARLDAIDAERWALRGDVARHYQEVADALRDYLELADGLPARERTTTELLWSLPPRLIEAGLRRRVQDVLGEADLVKFARRRPIAGEATGYSGRARDLLERWHRTAASGEKLDALR
jgi:hypothetical protein